MIQELGVLIANFGTRETKMITTKTLKGPKGTFGGAYIVHIIRLC